MIRGTKFYLPLEIPIDRKEATTASDMWALGFTIAELYSGMYFWKEDDISDVIPLMKKT